MDTFSASERRFGIFLILSVILHGVLLYVFPDLAGQLSLGSPWGVEVE